MRKLIMIKYGELTTKKDNINYFLSTLKDNVKVALNGLSANITYDKGRMFVYNENEEYDVIVSKLQKVFGIHEINVAYEIDGNDLDDVENLLKQLLPDIEFKTFKVDTKRADKTLNTTSMEVSRKMGGVVLKNKDNVSVDVHNPEIIINIELRHTKSYIYFGAYKGSGGYPVGCAGKGLLMLSGGIDSPVAGYMALKRGVRVEAIYFESPPHTSEAAKNKVKELATILSNYSGYVKLHVVNFTEIQENILKHCPHDYLVTIMRRMMYRISERIAKKNNCKVLINGESVGQVASQTLTSMSVINETIKTPVIRPVACLDKLEIIELAKKIETYETSILPYEDCCTIFVPTHPVINPVLELAIEYENSFDYQELINKAVYTEEVIKIENKISEEHDELL